jgi:Cu/Ag efflux protein CusF
MKKVLMIVLAVLIGVAFVTTVFAQEKKDAKPAAAAPAPEKAKEGVKKEAPKAQDFKGEFVSIDEKAKTIVAKDEKGEMTFDVAKIKKMAKFAAGDKIVVKYTEKDGKNVASSVKKAPAEKKEQVKKEAPKKEEKPAATPAAPAKK